MYPKTIGDKEYTRQQLLDYGRAHYPRTYWIKRGIGIGLMASGFLVFLISLIGIASINALAKEYNTDLSGDPSMVKMYVYLCASLVDAIIGIVLFCMSFAKKSDEEYITHAERILTKQAAMKIGYEQISKANVQQAQAIEENNSKIEELAKYKRLLDEGLITQEVYDAKKKELLK